MKIQVFLKKLNYPLVLMILIPTILSILWFRSGNIMGYAESGLPFYDFNIQYNINKDSWANYALGHPVNVSVAAAPAYWFFAQLQNLGIPPFILQAAFFWLIFVISGVSIYKLIRELFPNTAHSHALLSVLFYWFNPFSLVNVWSRFLNNYFVFFALLPLAVHLFIKGLRTRRYLFAILIGFVSTILAYALTSIAFILLLWGTLFYLGLFLFLIQKQDRIFTVKFFFLTISFWVFANFWWLSQVISYFQLGSFNAVSSTSFKTDNNYNTFSIISNNLGKLTYIFRLKHATFFSNIEQLEWMKIYSFQIVIFLEFLISSIFLLPLVMKKKSSYTLMIGSLLILSVFFAKGNSPPLGEIFDKAFLSFPLLQLFRNPFEKIGFILSFSASILFAIGVFELERFLGIKWKILARILIFSWVVIIWGFPFWTGYVFTSNEKPADKLEVGYRVKVPQDYKDASDWLNLQKDNFRMNILPIGGEGITYLWDKGYSGIELSNQILPKPSISFNTNIPFYDEISKDFERLFLKRDNFSKVMNIFNSKYLVLRSDIDWKTRRMRDPNNISSRIEQIASGGSLIKAKEFGKLSFWKNTDWKDRSIYLTNDLINSKQKQSIEDILNVESGKPMALYNSQIPSDNELTKSEIIYPNFKFSFGEQDVEPSVILREDIIFPAVNILPSSVLYPLIQIKERIEFETIEDPNYKIVKKITLLGKRLVEAKEELSLNNFDGAIRSLDNYEKQLRELSSYSLIGDSGRKETSFLQEDLLKLFLRHFEMIDSLMEVFPEDKREKVVQAQNLLKEFVINNGIKPIFGDLDKTDNPLHNRITYQFKVDKEGSYELLFNINNWDNYKTLFSESYLFQIDGNFISRKGEFKKNGLLSFGFLNLASGKHEIGWDTVEQMNLVDIPPEFLMEVGHDISEKKFPIKNLDPYTTYFLSLDYLIKKGDGVWVTIEGNNDSLKNNIVQRQFQKYLGTNAYDFDSKKYTAFYTPNRTSDTANLIFSVSPWNNCKDIYWTTNKERCEDEKFRRPYDRTTQVQISNVSLTKVMTEVPFLMMENKNKLDVELPEMYFKKINSSEYKVDIRNAKDKYALILSELYDPAWKVLEIDGKDITNNHFLANGYANGWVIDKRGDYEIDVKFYPQELLKKGKIVSVTVLILGLGIIGAGFIKLNK